MDIFISDKIDIKAKKFIRYRKTHYTMIKGSSFSKRQNSVYGLNNRAGKYMKQKLIKLNREMVI